MPEGEPGGLGTILILEDDPGIAHLERVRLRRAGYSVAVAGTADEARRVVGEGGVDLIVLDYRLDGASSGLDLHNEFRDAGLGLPSILVTGFGDERLLRGAIQAGVRDFLPKTPDYLDYLVPTVERVMAQVRTERQLEDERGRRLAEQAARVAAENQSALLAESEARFRVLTQAIPQLVWSCRPDGHVDFVNGQWGDYTGQTLEQTYGSGWLDAVHPDDLPEMRSQWRHALRVGDGFQTDCRIGRADGHSRWHLARAWPQRDDTGEVVRWFGTCTDIDDQKRAEEALKEADRRKDEFLAMLAHELRNPLAAVSNAVVLVRRSGDDEERDWAVSLIERQVGNLTHLIDDLLDVSRIATGKFRLRTGRVDAAEVVGHAAESVRPFVEAKRHALRLDIDPGPLWVEADPTRLEQVFVNLLTNAAKYTEEGGTITLTVRLVGGKFVGSVRDTGVGIPAAMLPRVFDLFTQVDGSLERSHGGLGIGLTLVRTLVAMHGGEVVAASDGLGLGSTFTVTIPSIVAKYPAESRALGQPAEATAPAPAADPVKPGHRILVVDDDADSSASLTRLLRALGHRVETAVDARSALETARAFRPEVILLDLRLPDADGYRLAEQIRLEPDLDHPLLVAVSGLAKSDDPALAGLDGYLTKPVDLDALLGFVERSGQPRPVS